MDHSACARALAQIAVLPELYRRVAPIYICIHEGSYRRIGVERFAAAKLLLLFLQIPIGNVEADGVPENMVECILRLDVLRVQADHDCKFSLKVSLVLGERYFDYSAMWKQRTRRLKPN